MKVDVGRGTPTFVSLRRDGGVTLHQGGSVIRLAPDELCGVLAAVDTVTSQGGRDAAEKTAVSGDLQAP